MAEIGDQAAARAHSMNPFRFLLPGRETRDRIEALERLVRKLAEGQREHASAANAHLAELTQQVAGQPTAKDLRELRQAVRGVVNHSDADDRRMFEALDRIAASGKPVVVGPWTGEVGFELLYWIPFLQWIRARWDIGGRELVISRGGVETWYGVPANAYADVFTVVTPDEFRGAVAEEKRKQRKLGAFDDRILDSVLRQRGLGDVETLHPGLMYRAFASYWNDQAGYARVDQFTRYRLFQPPSAEHAGRLPHEYVAARFYFSESFPATPENQAFARAVIASLAERIPVVLLNPGFRVDDHGDIAAAASGRIMTIAGDVTAARNLAVQSAVISRARAFVGTYGGYSYLAPLYGVPALAFYSTRSFKPHHLDAAQRAFANLGAATLLPLDVAQASLVQLALGALVTT
jgi:hypothetical protein